MAIEKIKILGAVLELPAKQHCHSIETYAPQFIGHNKIFLACQNDKHFCGYIKKFSDFIL